MQIVQDRAVSAGPGTGFGSAGVGPAPGAGAAPGTGAAAGVGRAAGTGPVAPILASFRPTPRQGIGRGLYLGAWGAAALAVLSSVALIVTRAARPEASPAVDRWLMATMAALVLAVAAGGLLGLALSRYIGADLDHRGMHRIPGGGRGRQPWLGIVDIRAERRGGRVEVRVYLRDGACLRMPAPYDGRLLAHDPGFEYKYQTLRQAWESHRDRRVD